MTPDKNNCTYLPFYIGGIINQRIQNYQLNHIHNSLC